MSRTVFSLMPKSIATAALTRDPSPRASLLSGLSFNISITLSKVSIAFGLAMDKEHLLGTADVLSIAKRHQHAIHS